MLVVLFLVHMFRTSLAALYLRVKVNVICRYRF